MTDDAQEESAPKDAQEWAVVELMGHRTRIGAISDVAQYGTSMLRIEVLNAQGEIDHQEDYSGSAIFSITRCEEAFARDRAKRYGAPSGGLLRYEAEEPDGVDE